MTTYQVMNPSEPPRLHKGNNWTMHLDQILDNVL